MFITREDDILNMNDSPMYNKRRLTYSGKMLVAVLIQGAAIALYIACSKNMVTGVIFILAGLNVLRCATLMVLNSKIDIVCGGGLTYRLGDVVEKINPVYKEHGMTDKEMKLHIKSALEYEGVINKKE